MITNVTKFDWKRVRLGPPNGLLLQSNRLLIPGDYSTNTGPFSSGFVTLNDDSGEVDSWYLGGEYSMENYFVNEAQAVELLPNTNTIFINARSNTTVRIGAYSHDGGLTFYQVNVLNTLVEPMGGCEGSTIYHSKSHQLFYTGLAGTSSVRTNLSLYTSEDNGQKWTCMKTIWKGPSAYSSLTIMNDESIGVLYEGGNITAYDCLMFTVIYNQTEQKFY